MKDKIIAWIYGLFIDCHHSTPTQKVAVYYCLALSVIFVGSLYVFVPPNIRQLSRDHDLHIQWRTVISFMVSVGAVFTYPLFFCDLNGPATWAMPDILQPRYVRGILLHTSILYLGPTLASILRVYEIRKRSVLRGRKPEHGFLLDFFHSVLKPSIVSFLNPLTESERWMNYRNFIAAPLTEEVVFRGCMVQRI